MNTEMYFKPPALIASPIDLFVGRVVYWKKNDMYGHVQTISQCGSYAAVRFAGNFSHVNSEYEEYDIDIVELRVDKI